jgi:hypothetical protein
VTDGQTAAIASASWPTVIDEPEGGVDSDGETALGVGEGRDESSPLLPQAERIDRSKPSDSNQVTR